MTAQERIMAMNNTIKAEQEKKRNDEITKEIRRQTLITQVISMGDRIRALIEVGEHVRMQNEMPIIDSLEERYHMDKVFVSNGSSHRVGFMGRLQRPITYVGFYAGGACGPWDFYTNGADVFLKHEDTGERKEPRIEDLKNFIDEFDDFEERFYKWFDKRFGVKTEQEKLLESYNLL